MEKVPFLTLFPGYLPEEALQDAVQSLSVTKADVDRQQRRIELQLWSEVYIKQKDLEDLQNELAAKFGIGHLKLNIRYPEEVLPQMDMHDLRQVFVRACAAASVVLAGAGLEVTDDAVICTCGATGKSRSSPPSRRRTPF